MYISIDGLVQDVSISIANALEIRQSYTKPYICTSFWKKIPEMPYYTHFQTLFHLNCCDMCWLVAVWAELVHHC